MASRRQLLLEKLKQIEEHILSLEGGGKKVTTDDEVTTTLLDPDDDKLHGSEDYHGVRSTIQSAFGTREDDGLATHILECTDNERLNKFIEEMGDANFYTYSSLMCLDTLDDGSNVAGFRSRYQLFLLPCFQIMVPFTMVWYFLIQKDLARENGYCNNHGDLVFRFTGFITWVYSAWQIIDGDNDPSAKFLLRHCAKFWALTGCDSAWKGTWMFFLGNLSQQLSAFAILILTYVIFTYVCETPLDLVMNCVAINFVLGVDSEWMSKDKQDLAVMSAKVLFQQWRDHCDVNEADVRYTMRQSKGLRRKAPAFIENVSAVIGTFIWIFAYCLVLTWTFCPSYL